MSKFYGDQALQEAYDSGVDCAKNGANTKNCNFIIFSSPEMSKAWQEGSDSLQG